MNSYPLKENHIRSGVSKILRTQTQTLPLYYKYFCQINRKIFVPCRSDPSKLISNFGGPFHRIKGPAGKVNNATGGAGNQTCHPLADSLEKSADALLCGALVGLEKDPRHSADNTDRQILNS